MFVPLMMVRTITPDQVGLFKIFFLYAVMAPTLAFTTGLISGLGYWAGQGERGRRAIQISNGLIVIAGLLLALICLIGSKWITEWFKWPDSYSIYFAITVLGTVCLTFLEESSIVTGKIWFGAIYTSTTEIFRSVLIVITAFIFHDLGAILLVASIISVTKLGLGIFLAKKRELIGFKFDWDITKDIFKYSLPVSFAWFVGIFTNSADQLVLSKIMSPADFAVYAIGCLIVPPLMIIEQSITRVMIPQLSTSFASGNQQKAAHHYRDAVEQIAWLLIPAVTGLIIFSEPIIHLLFTKQYTSATPYLKWFALSYLLLIFPHDAVPRARGEGRWILKSFTVFAAVPIVLCYLLGIKFGAFGALAGMLISRALMKLYAVVYIRTSTHWRFRDFIPFSNIAVFTAVSFLLALACMALRDPLGGGLLWFIVCGSLFTLFYFPLALAITNWRRQRQLIKTQCGGNVLLFTQHLGVGGLERLVLTLGQELRKSDHWDVFVFSHDSEENAEHYTNKTLVGDFLKSNIPVDALKKGSGICFKTLIRLVRNIYLNHIDVIHSHDMGTLVYAVLAKFLSVGRVRIVHTQHSFVHINRFKRYELYEKLFTRFVDELTVVNESLIEPYVKLGISADRIHVINNGVGFLPTPAQNRAEKIENRKKLVDAPIARPESFWILYLARLHSVKGQRDAASLWASLSPELREKSTLWIVGPEAETAEKEKVLSAFATVPNRDHVVFLDGTKTPHDWIAAADVYLSCSKFEGMPLGPLEAIGSGLPAVLSKIKGHEFLQTVSAQYALGNPADGAAQITAVLTQEQFGTEKYYADAWNRASWIREKFSLQTMARQYAQLYSGLRKSS